MLHSIKKGWWQTGGVKVFPLRTHWRSAAGWECCSGGGWRPSAACYRPAPVGSAGGTGPNAGISPSPVYLENKGRQTSTINSKHLSKVCVRGGGGGVRPEPQPNYFKLGILN